MLRRLSILAVLIVALALAPGAGAAPSYPQLPALGVVIDHIVGYDVPVVCEPSLAKGESISGITLTVTYAGRVFTDTRSYGPFAGDEDGVTLFASIAAGASVTVSYGGQTATLPTVPTSTPQTQQNKLAPPFVAVPIAIALDVSACTIWAADRDLGPCGACGMNDHGTALIVAIHEAMHAKYADGDEALTECRALQAFPDVMSSLFPPLSSPGREPARPKPPKARTSPATYRAALARWKKLDAAWRSASAAWTNEQAAQSAMTQDAHISDGLLPPEYHGGTC